MSLALFSPMTAYNIIRADAVILTSVACWVCTVHCVGRVLSRMPIAASFHVLSSYFLSESALRIGLSSL